MTSERKQEIREKFKANNFLGSEEYTNAVCDFWLNILDEEVEKAREEERKKIVVINTENVQTHYQPKEINK